MPTANPKPGIAGPLFRDGLHRTIDWYYATHDKDAIRAKLESMLTERTAPVEGSQAAAPAGS